MFHSFSITEQGPGIIDLFTFFQFYSVVCRDGTAHNSAGYLIIIIIIIIYSLEFFLHQR